MKVSGLGVSSVLMRQISNTQQQMGQLQTQLASGKAADTYGGLGSQRVMALSLQQEMSSISSYRDNITMADTRLNIMTNAADAMRDHASDMRADVLVGGFTIIDDGQTMAQAQAKVRLGDSIEMLNTDINGRSLFAGTKTDARPVVSLDEMLNGSEGKDGFRQIMNERLQADLGSDNRGRLELSSAVDTVSLQEDVDGSPFGFKIATVHSDLSTATVNGPAGSPNGISVQFGAGQPEPGETIDIQLDLPDGGTTQLRLTTSAESDVDSGTFAIGADADETAANFEAVLGEMLELESMTTLKAASMQSSADNFFTTGTETIQRVDGPPFDSATAMRAATDTDTVRWYQGEVSDSSARASMLAKVDDDQMVAYGARADEEAFANLVGQLAILSSAQFDESDDTAYAQYQAMSMSTVNGLSTNINEQSLDRVVGEFAIATNQLGEAGERHQIKDNLVTNYLADIAAVDTEEAAAKLMSLQTQLQASYQVTGMLSGLSLVNYL